MKLDNVSVRFNVQPGPSYVGHGSPFVPRTATAVSEKARPFRPGRSLLAMLGMLLAAVALVIVSASVTHLTSSGILQDSALPRWRLSEGVWRRMRRRLQTDRERGIEGEEGEEDGEEGEEVGAELCMPVLEGYPPWSVPTTVEGECEQYWGNGFGEAQNIFGTPPAGPFRDAEEAAAHTLAKQVLESALALRKNSSGPLKGLGRVPRRRRRALRLAQCLQQPRGVTAGRVYEGREGDPAVRSFRQRHLAEAGGFSPEAAESNTEASGGLRGASGQAQPRGGSRSQVRSQVLTSGWLRCFTNSALQESICEGSSVAVYPRRMSMVPGGEDLDDRIRGRGEDQELPVYSEGAVEVPVGPADEAGKRATPVLEEKFHELFPENAISQWSNLWGSMEAVPSVQCGVVEERPTLLVLRYEYVNLYHTATDWLNAYHSARVAGLSIRPQVVFLDGHAKGKLDSSWSTLFSGFRWIKSYEGRVQDKAVCFRHAVFVPLGYHSPAFRSHIKEQDDRRRCMGDSDTAASQRGMGVTTAVTEFAEFVVRSFGVQREGDQWTPELWRRAVKASRPGGEVGPTAGRWQRLRDGKDPVRVLFARRDPAWLHPRQADAGVLETRGVGDQEALVKSLHAWALQRGGMALLHDAERRDRELRLWQRRLQASSSGGGQKESQERRPGLGGALQSAEAYAAGGMQKPDWLHPGSGELPRLVFILNGTLVNWSLRQQLEAVQWADIIVGAHGAALTHVTFMRPDSALIEIRPQSDSRDFYEQLAWLRGIQYTRLGSDDVGSVTRAIMDVLGG